MLITCCACEQKNIEHSLDDPDFCQQCFDKIEGKGIMQRADAYIKYSDTYGYDEQKRKRVLFMGFMDLFHPEMPLSKRLQISRYIK